jgi:hypothetical protein
MTELKLAKLPSRTEEDAQAMTKLLGELAAEHAAGNVSELMFAYYDAGGLLSYAVSGNMSLLHEAFAVAQLQTHLMNAINRCPERTKPPSAA